MMTDHRFRLKSPRRTCEQRFQNYRSYKQHLIADFNRRCGYCDIYDGLFGGSSTFHIDHFAPKSKFAEQTCEYSNLVYACPFCNLGKGADWVSDDHQLATKGDQGYVDPCDVMYEELFIRDDRGAIVPKSELAKYIHKRLNLFLLHKRTAWMLSRIKQVKEKLRLLLAGDKLSSQEKTDVNELYVALDAYFDKYLEVQLGDF